MGEVYTVGAPNMLPPFSTEDLSVPPTWEKYIHSSDPAGLREQTVVKIAQFHHSISPLVME